MEAPSKPETKAIQQAASNLERLIRLLRKNRATAAAFDPQLIQ